VRVRGVSEVEWGGWGGGMIVRSDSPRPPRRRHRGGTPVLMPNEASKRLQQCDDTASGGEGRVVHRGSSDDVSCARDDRQQVPCSAGGLSDRLVGDMEHGSVLGGCELRLPPWEEKLLTEQKPLGLTLAAGGMVMKVLSGGEGGGGPPWLR
jgi:hypothetical protein